jgi:hypothetical protein
VRARNSEIRYGTWLRKPRGKAAEWSSKISRQDNRFVIHESLLTLGNTRINLSGFYEHGSRARLQLRAGSDRSDLSQLIELFPALQAFRASGNLHGEVLASKVMIGDSSWNINGELAIAEAELRHENSSRKIERLSASILFLGKQARVENAAFRIRSSNIEMTGAVADLAIPTLTCELRSANLNLVDLADFPVAKSDRLENVRLSGKLALAEDGTPWLRGTVSSPDGTLQDLTYLDLRSEIIWSAAEISLRDFSFRALNGTWRSRDVSIAETGKSQRLKLYSQLNSVDLKALLTSKLPAFKNRIEGQLNFQGEFSAQAHNGAIKPGSLEGSGQTRIQGGTLKDFNLIALMMSRIGSSGSAISLQLSPSLADLAKSKDTPFETLEALVILDQEGIRTENLQLSTANYRIMAAGWMMTDQVTRWNGMLVIPLRISQELLRENKSLRYLLDRSGQINLPFRVEGTLANLRVRPDTRIIAQIVRRGSLPKTIEPPAIDKRPEAQEQKESLPAELEQFLSR